MSVSVSDKCLSWINFGFNQTFAADKHLCLCQTNVCVYFKHQTYKVYVCDKQIFVSVSDIRLTVIIPMSVSALDIRQTYGCVSVTQMSDCISSLGGLLSILKTCHCIRFFAKGHVCLCLRVRGIHDGSQFRSWFLLPKMFIKARHLKFPSFLDILRILFWRTSLRCRSFAD